MGKCILGYPLRNSTQYLYTILHTTKRQKRGALAVLFGENAANKIHFEVNNLYLTSI